MDDARKYMTNPSVGDRRRYEMIVTKKTMQSLRIIYMTSIYENVTHTSD